ncbi:MAG: hypothetical protein Q9163_003689 [Psora crenata]
MSSPQQRGICATTPISPTLKATPQLPAPPSPSTDAGIAPKTEGEDEDQGTLPGSADVDIFKLSALAALKILCGFLETLICITGNIPSTPPMLRSSFSSMDISREDREHRAWQGEADRKQERRSSPWPAEDVLLTPIGSSKAQPTKALHIPEADLEPLYSQHRVLIRKFYSKKPPPISLEEYLRRLHKYCPMSPAVYLATGLYIYKLAIIEKAIPLTAQNAHRLVLAGLRVAMKALEDLSYPHSRFAKVGGVTESELARLEVSFCFVIDFNLRVTSEMLLEHTKIATDTPSLYRLPEEVLPEFAPLQDKRNVILGQSKSLTSLKTEASPAAG